MTAPKMTIDLQTGKHNQYIIRSMLGGGRDLPIHRCSRRIRCTWEKLKDPSDKQEGYGYDVDRVACFAKAESRWWESFAANTLQQNAY